VELAGKDVLVMGLGLSGRSAAAFCAERGARVVAADERPAAALGPLTGLGGVELRTGAPFPDPAGFDLVVPSPGVPRGRWAGARRAWGDLELAWRALAVPIVAITGTNGKSTTTLLVEAMLRAAGLRARAGGNIGIPALSLVAEPLDVVVLEVSSFQLEATEGFRPRVGVVLNVTPDHFDRHGDFEGYVRAKARLLANQRPEDAAVLNARDERVRALAAEARGRVYFFDARGPVERGVGFDAGAALLRDGGALRRIPLDDLRLVGLHNRENALAAMTALHALGVEPEKGRDGLARFTGLPHRCEPVAEARGALWVNDSKATNPGAALRSLEGFPGPLVWIAGGRNKALAFDELAAAASGRVRKALLIGEAAAELERALAGRVEAERVGDLASAVRRAAEIVRPGDVVLLAPACASQDQFRNFEERGERFADAVRALAR
jgi:UDP-N-acetylmuramoylalanine--D-glutamate ligase